MAEKDVPGDVGPSCHSIDSSDSEHGTVGEMEEVREGIVLIMSVVRRSQ